MANDNFDYPRPTNPVPSATSAVINDDAKVLDYVVNSAGSVVTRTGKTLLTLNDALNKFGFGVAPFTFTTGGTLTSLNLLVSNSPVDGFLYKYVGAGNAPITVTAGTDPTAGSDWQAFAATNLQTLGGLESPSDLDKSYRRAATVAQVENGDFAVGSRLTVTDRGDAPFDVVAGGTPNGSNILDAGAGRTAELRISNPINVLHFGGDFITDSINRALAYFRGRANLVPWAITVPQNPSGGAWDWPEVVDMSDDSWVKLEGDGMVAAKATAAINCFVQMGIGNKNNETQLGYFSFDCGDQSMEAAVITGSIRGVDVHHIETKATGTGSFVDGVLVAGDEKHTGTEFGGGNEQSTFTHIFDSGDSSVSRDMVHFTGGTSLGVIVDNVRATRENFDNVVGSSLTSGFNGCSFTNIHAVMLTERIVKANSIVNLKRSVNATYVGNIGLTGNPNQNNVNYGLLVDGLSATVSSSLHAENCGIGYIVNDVEVPSTVVRTHINSVSKNNGDPNSQGVISATPSVRESGGVIWDNINKTIFVGATTQGEDYQTPLLKRRVQIADDGIYKFTFQTGDYRLTGTIISVVADMSAGVVREGLVSVRCVGTSSANKLTNGGNFAVQTGVLTGTTGIDGNVTVSANAADTSIYVENRTGASRNFTITFLS